MTILVPSAVLPLRSAAHFPWWPLIARVTELTVQVKDADPVPPVVSVTVTVTPLEPGVVGVPVIRPVPALMASPAGKPAAL